MKLRRFFNALCHTADTRYAAAWF